MNKTTIRRPLKNRSQPTGTGPESIKEEVLETVSRMADRATFSEIIEEIQIHAALRESLEDAAAGRVFTHAEVMKRSSEWHLKSSGRELPGKVSRKPKAT